MGGYPKSRQYIAPDDGFIAIEETPLSIKKREMLYNENNQDFE